MKKLDKALSFDDILLLDRFSEIRSRGDKEVDTSVTLMGHKLTTPVVASNMMCVTNVELANAMKASGAYACLPRFMPIEQNVEEYKNSTVMVSLGLGDKELERAKALFDAGATQFLIDVAHGANIAVVEHMKRLREVVKTNAAIAVGNFSNLVAFDTFEHKVASRIDAIKVGIGGGGACITRHVTGCGMPTFASIVDLAECGYPVIADGGIRNSGDMNKALAAGATVVMCGRMFVGCPESPAETYMAPNPINGVGVGQYIVTKKKYSGSASAESYEAQGKTASFRAPEGETYWVPVCGPVKNVVQSLNGGLRSCMSYNNANTIEQLRENAYFIEVTANGVKESGAHGKM